MFSWYGHPCQIHSDQGSQFTANLISAVCQKLGIEVTQTPSYNPKPNSVERSQQDLNTMLQALCIESPEQDWEDILPACLLTMHTARNHQTGYTSHYLLFGREVATPSTSSSQTLKQSLDLIPMSTNSEPD